MRAIAKLSSRISRGLNTAALLIAVLAVVIMIYAVSYQVVARYIFSAPPAWTEELARYAMVWAGLMGATVAFYTNSDPTLFPAKREIKGLKGLGYALLRATGVLTFALPVLYFSVFGTNQNVFRGFIMRTLEREAETLGISMAFITFSIPLAFSLVVIHLLADLISRISDLRGDEA